MIDFGLLVISLVRNFLTRLGQSVSQSVSLFVGRKQDSQAETERHGLSASFYSGKLTSSIRMLHVCLVDL